MNKLLKSFKNNKHGFSLVELIVVIAIMAVIAAVLIPSLLMHVEESRAEKDIKTTDEVVTAVELALADQDVYDELVEHSVFDNVSCYVDKDSESGYEKTVIKETYNGHAEQYMFDDNARQNDEIPYCGAGNMRGLTVTFSPEKDSNESSYDLSRGIINRFVGRKTGYLYENEKLYNAIRSVVGDKIYNSSQTYRNSDFTIFIRLGTAGGNEAGNQDATQVWGQYNGTNLPADKVQTAKITTDREVGDAGQYDQTVNDYINDESNTNIDFSQLAQMGNSNFGSTLKPTTPSLDLSTVNTNLTTNTWEDVQKVVKANKVAEAGWKIGDKKMLTINGYEQYATLIGINHDGENTATFMITENIQWKSPNKQNTNSGGWESSVMRNWLNTDIFNSMTDTKDYIKEVVKMTNNIGHQGDEVSGTRDKVFLLSTKEVGLEWQLTHKDYWDGYDYMNAIDNEGESYEWFKNGGYINGFVWLRSPDSNTETNFFVWELGNIDCDNANIEYCTCPAFVIG